MIPAPDKTDGEKADRLPYLDGLRGIAILLVIGMHYLVTPYHPPAHAGSWFIPVHHLLGAAWIGVDLFFVLSGFLLGGILMAHRNSANLFPVFYVRRACRIVPAYWIFLSPLALVPILGIGRLLPALPTLINTGTIPSWVYPLFLQNLVMTAKGTWGQAWIDTTWSLAVEEQFYLILPLLICYMPPKRLPIVLVALVLTAPALRIALHLWASGPQAELGSYTLLPCRWDSLLLGVLTAWLIRDRRTIDWLQSRAGGLRRTGLLLAATVMVLAYFSPGLDSVPMYSCGYTLFAALFAIIILCGQIGPFPGLRLLEWPLLCWIGRISYMLYLVHVPLSAVVFHFALHRPRELDNLFSLGLMACSLVLSLAVAALSWEYLEGPILAFARKFKYAPAGEPTS